MDIWSGGAAQHYDLLRVFESPAYFSAKDDKVNLRAKKFIFFGLKRNMNGYKLWEPENKKIVLSKHVTFDETSLLKYTIFQQVKRLKLWMYHNGWRLMLLHHLQLVRYQ